MPMADLQITGVDRLESNRIVIQLSDGRALAFSLQKLLTLVPDEVVTGEGTKSTEA